MPHTRSEPAGRNLRFADDREAVYLASHLRRMRLRVRVWFSSVAVMIALLTVRDVWGCQLSTGYVLLRAGALLPCTVALTWLAWSRCYGRF
ncbi:MAG: hypothetical protein JWO52_6414 [Gammaproteobacteria bacterium]|nr:hypothetical protein [Gammaproteobacteria bacterium]